MPADMSRPLPLPPRSSYRSAGRMNHDDRAAVRAAVLQAPHVRVVFAGSDIGNGWNGFVDGAIESGLTAARSANRLLAG